MPRQGNCGIECIDYLGLSSVPGARAKEFKAGSYYMQTPLIIGKRSESTDRKTSLNKALRDFEVQV